MLVLLKCFPVSLTGLVAVLLTHSFLFSQAKIQVPYLICEAGEDIVIPVLLFEGSQISAIHFDLELGQGIEDSQIVQNIRGTLLGDHSLAIQAHDGGMTALISSATSAAFSGDQGTLFLIRRTVSAVLQKEARLPVILTRVKASDSMGNPVLIEVSSGEIRVGSGKGEPVPGTSDLYFPQIADGTYAGGKFRTLLILVDLAGVRTEAVASFFNSNGAPFFLRMADGRLGSDFSFTLEPFGSVFLSTDSSGPLAVGYAEVRATSPVGGTLLFAAQDGSGRTQSEAGVGTSPPRKEFSVPIVFERGISDTGIALVNPTDSNVDLGLSLRTSDNQEIAKLRLLLEAGRHLPQFASEFFPQLRNTGEFRGFIRVIATRPVSAIALKQRGALLTTFPVVGP